MPLSQRALDAAYIGGLALASPFLVYKSLTTGKYREGLSAKFYGRAPKVEAIAPVVWIHAVSVGEVLLLAPLIEKLQSERPESTLVLSTSTNTGFAVAREKYPALEVFYAPLDFSWAVRRVFEDLQPNLVVLTELELWPNLLLEAKSRCIPVAVVNARLGEKSYRGYRRLRKVLGPSLQAVCWWGAQTEVYARRIADLVGDASGRIDVTGSMKYDGVTLNRDNQQTRRLRDLLGLTRSDLVWVAGSTMHPEEEIVLDAYAQLRERHPKLRLILVPRHKERFEQVARLLELSKLPFVRRSRLDESRSEAAPITLLDTIGELKAAWGLADVGFVGGSLECRRGGQSMIEPAAYGVPVCFGPNTWNFKDAVESLLSIDAAVRLRSRNELTPLLERWLTCPDEAAAVGGRAQEFILTQQGAVDRTFAGLAPLMPSDVNRRCA